MRLKDFVSSLVLAASLLLMLPSVIYVLDPLVWLWLYPLILSNVQVLVLIAIALLLYYRAREGTS